MNFTKLTTKLWEIVGFSIAILFLLGVLAIFAGIGFAVYQYKTHHVAGLAVEPKGDQGKLKLTVEYGLPLSLEESDYFMIPVKLEKKKQGEEREAAFSEGAVKRYSYDSYASSSSGSYYSYWGPFYNLVFINKKTGESRPLLSAKGYIDGVYFPEKKYGEKKTKTKPTFVLLKIATADTNHDGLLNEKDASAGFIAGIDGTKLTQITPAETQMRWWYYDNEAHRLFVEIVRDANQDKKFNWDDPQTTVSVDVLAPKIGQEVVPADIQDKIDTLLLKK